MDGVLILPQISNVLIFIFQLNTKTSPATNQAPGPEEKGEWVGLGSL